jgi:hypothetical protein
MIMPSRIRFYSQVARSPTSLAAACASQSRRLTERLDRTGGLQTFGDSAVTRADERVPTCNQPIGHAEGTPYESWTCQLVVNLRLTAAEARTSDTCTVRSHVW